VTIRDSVNGRVRGDGRGRGVGEVGGWGGGGVGGRRTLARRKLALSRGHRLSCVPRLKFSYVLASEPSW